MMNVIIVGGGKTGVYVANLLLANHCRVKVLESRRSVLEKVKEELPLQYAGSCPAGKILAESEAWRLRGYVRPGIMEEK